MFTVPGLTLEAVTKTYPRAVRAVDALTLAIADGEMLVLAGPSGCGKTTTLRLVAGLEEVTSGTIRIGARVVNDVPPGDRDVAMVFQNYALYPHLTARRNLAFGPRMRGTAKAEIARRVDEAAALLGLGDLLDRRPRALSGGEQQRVAIGRVLVRRPACALYDEPLSNLDASLRHRLRADLRRLHAAAPTTSIYVTHAQEDAMTLGDRLAVMAGGRLLQVGAPLELYERPATRFVAAFLGSPPMNFVEGRVRREGDAVVFTDGDGFTLPLPDAIAGRLGDRGEVVLGVRPGDLRIGRGAGCVFEIAVTEVAPLGAYTDVRGTIGSAEIVARDGNRCGIQVGERVVLHVAPPDVHLFAPGPYGERV